MSALTIAVPKEVKRNERRVACTPSVVAKLCQQQLTVTILAGAGVAAGFSDEAYQAAGAEMIADEKQLWSTADVVLKVNPPESHEYQWLEQMRPGAVLISFIMPARQEALLEKLKQLPITVLAMDMVPRISRAQSMDALSSLANTAGYRAVIEASHAFQGYFPGQITAAGRILPAKVLVIGAGVAGLTAIAVAKNLGAVVRAFDTRLAAKTQVESLGGEFLELEFEDNDGEGSGGYAKVMSEEFIAAEMALFAEQAREVDIIITTAQVPGHKAPVLISEEMVNSMRPGAVIVDLAAEQGGNCAVTEPGQAIQHQGVTVIGYTDLPSRMPTQASEMYANNLFKLLQLLIDEASIRLDLDDVIVRQSLISQQGELMWPPPKLPEPAAPAQSTETEVPTAKPEKPAKSRAGLYMLCIMAVIMLIGWSAPGDFMGHLGVFALSCIIGWQVIWNVTPALHTPLMSVTNAISGIIVIGALLLFSANLPMSILIMVWCAAFVAAINVVGGFWVTRRMLKMFRR